jgi:putative SOS response-associated peptidase YedK
MCYAFSLRSDPSSGKDYTVVAFGGRSWKPSYNIRPGEMHPIETQEQPKQLTLALWNFVPHWMPDLKKGVINARAETLGQKPYFRSSFLKHRCAILADGFYEFVKDGDKRTPYFFHKPNNERFVFAGVYDALPGKAGEVGFAIITTTPNSVVEPIHDRMPVILEPEGVSVWLDAKATAAELQKLLVPCANDLLIKQPANVLVNSPHNKGPEVLKKI